MGGRVGVLELVELAKSLIAFRTVSPPGDEEQCARFIGDYLADLHIEGMTVRVDRFERGRANLVANLGPEEPGLLLGGHIDVVPPGNESEWSNPPFEGQVRGGLLYGRGAADMKTGLAAILKAVEAAKGKASMKRGLTIAATAGEEVGFDGLKSLLRRNVMRPGSARFGVLAEPTDLRPVRAHKGMATFLVRLKGKSGHASSPNLGVNAIEKCARFVEALASSRTTLGRASDEELGNTIATPTVIKGGVKSNVIPESCELTVDARWIPKHGTAFVERHLNSLVASLRTKEADFDAEVELVYDTGALKLRPTHPIVRLAESLTGAKSEAAPYGTEAALYTEHGIPSIVLGPGDVKQAHIVDEFVDIVQAKKAVSVYTKMIESVCCG
jgi:succinyl-diaminopimelate desuccinylase